MNSPMLQKDAIPPNLASFRVSAEPVYRQMKELQAKVTELRSARAGLDAQIYEAKQTEIDEAGLRARLARAVRPITPLVRWL